MIEVPEPEAGGRTDALPVPARGIPVLYIGGCGRSGSTLLDRALGQLPGYWSLGELVHLWLRGLQEDELCGCGLPFLACSFWGAVGDRAFGGWDRVDVREVLRLKSRVDRNRYIPLMVFPWLSPSYRERMRRYTELLGRLYAAAYHVSGARLLVDSSKHPSMAFLLRRVPGLDFRLIHLVRDSRGVAYSWTKRVHKPEVKNRTVYMMQYAPVRMGRRWVSFNLLFHLLGAWRVPHVFVRYEAFVERPVEGLARIVETSPVPVGGDAFGFVAGDTMLLAPGHTVSGNPMRFERGRVAVRLDDEWRQKMGRRARATVTALTWPMLALYGYTSRRPRRA